LEEMSGYLLPEEPVDSVESYRSLGGGEGIARAHEIGPEETIAMIEHSRLRGRGGAGFPTGIKWRGVAGPHPEPRRFVVCNAAAGEPGTLKDRAHMRSKPCQ